jgi:hypothetical protein
MDPGSWRGPETRWRLRTVIIETLFIAFLLYALLVRFQPRGGSPLSPSLVLAFSAVDLLVVAYGLIALLPYVHPRPESIVATSVGIEFRDHGVASRTIAWSEVPRTVELLHADVPAPGRPSWVLQVRRPIRFACWIGKSTAAELRTGARLAGMAEASGPLTYLGMRWGVWPTRVPIGTTYRFHPAAAGTRWA